MTLTPLDIHVLRALQAPRNDAPIRITHGEQRALVQHDPSGTTVFVDGHPLLTAADAAEYLRDALKGYERVGTGTPDDLP